jgi:hypothetical protein
MIRILGAWAEHGFADIKTAVDTSNANIIFFITYPSFLLLLNPHSLSKGSTPYPPSQKEYAF